MKTKKTAITSVIHTLVRMFAEKVGELYKETHNRDFTLVIKLENFKNYLQ